MEKVLVLNSDYTPLNITSVMRGFILVHKGKAEILRESEIPINAGDKSFIRPLIIRLLNYVKYRLGKLKISRNRIFKRDNYQCCYCGTKKNLTVDHIIPKSRGGQNTWTNLITCCSNCNRKKGDKTPEEINFKLLLKPYEPSLFSDIINPNIGNIWDEFKISLGI